MLLCDLPEVIIAIIIEGRLGVHYNAVYYLKEMLPLLAVCRQWRRVAIPLVYNAVFVKYRDDSDSDDDASIDSQTREETTNVVIKTNLDLVAMVSHAHAVKRVRIDVHCLTNPLPGWQEVIQRMRTAASKWRVVELAVDMQPDEHSYDGNVVDMANYADEVAEVSDMLTTLMPDVRSLECGSNRSPISQSLWGRLASHYAEQLQRFESHRPMILPLDCQFVKLKMFHTNYNYVNGYQLPHVASGELVEVSLVYGPPNHSWASFSADNDSWAIEFPNLTKLCVEYHSVYLENEIAVRHRDGHPWRLHFPSLKVLYIECFRDICPLLEYAVLPPHMESITLDMRSAAYLEMASVVLPMTKRLSICISRHSSGDPIGLPVANRILESAHGCEELKLRIDDQMVYVLPETLTCTALTHLEVSSIISVDTMFAVIRTLPKLVMLALHNLDLSNIRANLRVTYADKDAVVESLHPSLKSLYITASWNSRGRNTARAVAMLQYMLLRIPTLTRAHSWDIPKEPVRHFVWSYTPRYPHLSGVVLELHGERESPFMWPHLEG
ncbi:hypothetical protein H4R21_003789 [Coemansia helicoidea]|uniref:Uncharacterized protein n=1 Tax=Coemansia helicoidea TaxID=1286919 RepID=A0ACC1L1Y1_9FUNG|nr:hypothetical protein H4R21_003789 [Coemansia helicoidea]